MAWTRPGRRRTASARTRRRRPARQRPPPPGWLRPGPPPARCADAARPDALSDRAPGIPLSSWPPRHGTSETEPVPGVPIVGQRGPGTPTPGNAPALRGGHAPHDVVHGDVEAGEGADVGGVAEGEDAAVGTDEPIAQLV